MAHPLDGGPQGRRAGWRRAARDPARDGDRSIRDPNVEDRERASGAHGRRGPRRHGGRHAARRPARRRLSGVARGRRRRAAGRRRGHEAGRQGPAAGRRGRERKARWDPDLDARPGAEPGRQLCVERDLARGHRRARSGDGAGAARQLPERVRGAPDHPRHAERRDPRGLRRRGLQRARRGLQGAGAVDPAERHRDRRCVPGGATGRPGHREPARAGRGRSRPSRRRRPHGPRRGQGRGRGRAARDVVQHARSTISPVWS